MGDSNVSNTTNQTHGIAAGRHQRRSGMDLARQHRRNITIRGFDWASLGAGSRLALGPDVVLEITGLTDSCKQIAASFLDRNFRRIRLRGDSRHYARVLAEGPCGPTILSP